MADLVVLTRLGRSIISNRIKGNGTEPSFVGVGTGAGTATDTDTAQNGEVGSRAVGTSTIVNIVYSQDGYRVFATYTAAVPIILTNFGLWDSAIGGNLMVKVVLGTPKALDAAQSVGLIFKVRQAGQI